MKIAHLITRLVRGGAQRNTLMCAIEQARHGHHVTLVTGTQTGPEGSLLEEAQAAPVRLVLIPHLVRDVSPVHDLLAFTALWRLLSRERFDIVHTHTSKAGILGRWCAWLAGVPGIVHTPHGHVFHGYFPPLTSACFRWLERLTARLTHRLVMLTQGCLRDHLQARIAPADRFVVIPSGVALQAFRSTPSGPGREGFGLPPEARLAGCVARLVEVKGLLDLVEAMARVVERVPSAHLALAGEGPLRPALESRIRSLGLDSRVTLMGYVEEIAPFLRTLDVFVLPSHNEGMGRAVVEAMAAGLPVVATAVGGLPDVVLPHRTGLLVPPRDPGALAEALADLLENPSRACAMGEEGRRHARRFSDQVMYRALEALYEEVLESARARRAGTLH